VDDWDHSIYILGADVASVISAVGSAAHKKGTQAATGPVEGFHNDAIAVLQDAFSSQGKIDSFNVAKVCRFSFFLFFFLYFVNRYMEKRMPVNCESKEHSTIWTSSPQPLFALDLHLSNK